MLKRLFDFLFSIVLILIFSVPMLLLFVLVRLTSPGPAVYWSNRVGRYNQVFRMPKFRSMHIHAPVVATHLLDNPDQFITPLGRFLRKSSLDELPQLWSILKGDMSFVGPRPALDTQHDLISLRTVVGVHQLRPGLTGWAQVNGRDELSIDRKVAFDAEYCARCSFFFDCYIIFITIFRVFLRQGVSH